jgi:hypothetical protein
MALFKADPEKSLLKDLEKRRGIRDSLAADLAEAELAVVERREAAEQLAMDGGDVKARRAATSDLVHAKEYVAVTSGSLTKIGEQIAILEREIAEVTDKKVRAETAATIVSMAEDLAKAGVNLAAAMAELEQKSAVIAGRFQEHGQFLAVMKSLHVELPLTVTQTVIELRSRAAAVIAGHGQAFLPLLAQPALPTPKPDMVSLCSIKNVAFHDGNPLRTAHPGIRTAHPGYKIELLPEVAANALKIDACCRLDDPRAEYHSSQRKVTTPLIENCVALDSQAAVAIAAASRGSVVPIMRSGPPGVVDARPTLQQVAAMRDLPPGFTEIDRGPPGVAIVQRSNPQLGPQDGGNDDEK